MEFTSTILFIFLLLLSSLYFLARNLQQSTTDENEKGKYHVENESLVKKLCPNSFKFIPLTRFSADKKIIQISSFPGGGSNWMRFLLEHATGILTGSTYIDPTVNFFKGEGVSDGKRVLAIRTHYPCPNCYLTKPKSNETISLSENVALHDFTLLVLRNPFHTLFTYYFQLLNQSSIDEKEHDFEDFALNKIYNWISHLNYYLFKKVSDDSWKDYFDKPVFLFRFESLRNKFSPPGEIERLLRLVIKLGRLKRPHINIQLARECANFKLGGKKNRGKNLEGEDENVEEVENYFNKARSKKTGKMLKEELCRILIQDWKEYYQDDWGCGGFGNLNLSSSLSVHD